MRIGRRSAVVGLVVGGALLLGACGGSGDNKSSDGSGAVKTNATAIVTTNGSEPQKPLIPSNTTEVGGGKIVDLLFAGLVSYDADGKTHMEVAKSIESPDATTWTVKLNDGWTFTNGEKVTADSFINAWDWAAQVSNKQGSQYFFDGIKGFDDQKDSKLTGLKKVSDLEFTITLTSPASDFPMKLGYSAFYPLPSVAYTDMAAFGQNPIGDGVYKFASDSAWEHNVQASLVVNDTYTGPRKAKNGGVTVKFYTSLDSAYSDLSADQLDVLDQIPDAQLSTFVSDLGDRAVNQPAAILQTLDIPVYGEHFKMDEEGRLRRAAISHAINRDEITKVIFQDTRTPAKDFTSPVLDGWSADVPGNDVLTYDAAKAKELWAQADAISKYTGTFYLSYNADGPHQAWIDAVANSLKNTLGISAEGKPYPTFQDSLKDREANKVDGSVRAGWQADYPSMFNFLSPLYRTGAGSNYGRYTSTEFDGLLDQAASAPSTDEANALLQKAQTVLFTDLPAIPLWYQNVSGGFSKKVSNVKFGWNSVPIYYEITKSA